MYSNKDDFFVILSMLIIVFLLIGSGVTLGYVIWG